MNLRHTLLFAVLALTACQTHHHALTVTSEPTAQSFEIRAYDLLGNKMGPLHLQTSTYPVYGKTPQQIMYSGKVAYAKVTLKFSKFDYDSQTKVVQFGHPNVDITSYHEPIFDLSLGSIRNTKISPQTVHFDKCAK